MISILIFLSTSVLLFVYIYKLSINIVWLKFLILFNNVDLHKIKLIVEVDGSIHDVKDVKENDKKREDDLRGWGNTIIRFTNENVFKNLDRVHAEINKTVENLINSSKELPKQ